MSLPNTWTTGESRTSVPPGRPYYYNHATGKSQWTCPIGFPEKKWVINHVKVNPTRVGVISG